MIIRAGAKALCPKSLAPLTLGAYTLIIIYCDKILKMMFNANRLIYDFWKQTGTTIYGGELCRLFEQTEGIRAIYE